MQRRLFHEDKDAARTETAALGSPEACVRSRERGGM